MSDWNKTQETEGGGTPIVERRPVTTGVSPLQVLSKVSKFDSLLGHNNSEEGPAEDMDVDETAVLSRQEMCCEFTHARFVLEKKKQFTVQYSNIYQMRLVHLRKVLQQRVRAQWGAKISIVEKVIELSPQIKDEVVVIGTVYKQQNLKPSVLDEFRDEFGGDIARNELDNYCDDEDLLILEDESGRVDLINVPTKVVDSLVTGVIMAVKGVLRESGEFEVRDILFPGLPTTTGKREKTSTTNPQYLVLVSGLNVGQANNDDPLRYQLLFDYLSGHLGSDGDQLVESNIVRLIIAGGSVASTKLDSSKEQENSNTSSKQKQKENKLTQPVKQLDLDLTQLSACLPVTILPGEGDPTNITLPQQPLHPCLFPQANRYEETFKCVTNPCEMKLNKEITVLGSGGQPISNMLKYTRSLSPVDLLEKTLEWRHIAPTCPDTLPCFPLSRHDPFILEERPHLYFAGNQDQFETKLIDADNGDGEVTRLVAVPNFSTTGLVVLVDLASPDLKCHTIKFAGN